jgi:hypothetical protein
MIYMEGGMHKTDMERQIPFGPQVFVVVSGLVQAKMYL